jgi:Pyruvate/2-oxoacid:ferredoxin oxidoreductase delta subunit
MGHMGQLKEEYRALMDRLDHHAIAMPRPEDQRALEGWRELLEVMYTPEEAELASRMPMVPTSLRRLARRYDLPEEELKQKLEPLCDKGLIMDLVSPKTGDAKYLLAPPVVGFFEFSMMRAHDMFDKLAVAKAMDAYMHGDDTFAREVFGHDTVVGRAMVHEDVLAQGIPEVLDWERTTRLIEESKQIAVSHCYCRHKAEHVGKACDVPQEICLSINGGANFVIGRGFGRPIDKQEALSIVKKARKLGLVQIADNVKNEPAYVCNCCACCCGQLSSINDFGLKAVNPSGFEPAHHPDDCKGCSRCSRACPVAAITMTPARAGNARTHCTRPSIRSSALGAAFAPRPASRMRSAWSAERTRATCPKTRSSVSCAKCSSAVGWPTFSSTKARAVARRSSTMPCKRSPSCLRPSGCSLPIR